MKALLLLGGFGTRMRPFTITTPKSLLPVVNIPFIRYQFALLKKYNIKEVILGVGYKGEEFKKILGIAKEMGLKPYLSFEKKPLGTAGGIRNAYKFLKGKEPFFVFNGDILADFNLEKIMSLHKEKNAYVTIGLVKVDNPSAYGLVITDENMKIQKFVEKPKPDEIVSDTINAGVYVFNPEVLEEIPPGKEVSVERETFPQILEKGKDMFGYVHYGYWLDVGTIDKFKKANFDVLDGKIELEYKSSGENLEADKTAVISENIEIEGKLVVGKNSVIERGSKFSGKVIVGDGVYIGENVQIENSIIFSETVIRENSVIVNSIIGEKVFIKNNSEIKNSALGDNCFIVEFSKTGM